VVRRLVRQNVGTGAACPEAPQHSRQNEIEQAATLAEEVADFLALYNEVRPHESLRQRIPLVVHRADPHLFQALSLQDP
jgi:hypothetical protein